MCDLLFPILSFNHVCRCLLNASNIYISIVFFKTAKGSKLLVNNFSARFVNVNILLDSKFENNNISIKFSILFESVIKKMCFLRFVYLVYNNMNRVSSMYEHSFYQNQEFGRKILFESAYEKQQKVGVIPKQNNLLFFVHLKSILLSWLWND